MASKYPKYPPNTPAWGQLLIQRSEQRDTTITELKDAIDTLDRTVRGDNGTPGILSRLSNLENAFSVFIKIGIGVIIGVTVTFFGLVIHAIIVTGGL